MDDKGVLELFKQLFCYCQAENKRIHSDPPRTPEKFDLVLMSNEKIYSKFKSLVLDLLEFKKKALSQPTRKLSNTSDVKEFSLLDENHQLKFANQELKIKLEVLRRNLMEAHLKLADHEKSMKERLSDVFDSQKLNFDCKNEEINDLVIKTKGFKSPPKVPCNWKTEERKNTQTIKSVRFEYFGKKKGRKEVSLSEGFNKTNSFLNSPSKGPPSHVRSSSDVLIKLS
jgi:hypothetical protein